MLYPDFSDICNEDFSFEYLLKESNEKSKEMAEERKANRDLCYPQKSECLLKKLPTGNCTGVKLPAFSTIKPTNANQQYNINPSMNLTSNSLDDKIDKNETARSEKNSNNALKENEFKDFLKPFDVRTMKENYNPKNTAKKCEEDNFWDFIKANTYDSCDGKNNLGLSEAELRELRNLSSITPSSGYGSGASCMSEVFPTPGFSSSFSAPAEQTNAPSNANIDSNICKINSNISYHKENITDAERLDENSSNTLKSLNELEDFLKPPSNKAMSEKNSLDITKTEYEDELWDTLNSDKLLNFSCDNFEKGDKFWDFLKPDVKCDLEPLTAEEIEELRSLSSITSSPHIAISHIPKDCYPSKTKSAVTSETCTNVESQLTFLEEDIFKDLDFLGEMYATAEDMQKQTEPNQQSVINSSKKINTQKGKHRSGQKSSNLAPAVKLTDKSKSYDPKIINQNIPVAVFPPFTASIPFRKSQSKTLNKNQLQSVQQSVVKQGNGNAKLGIKQVSNTPHIFLNNANIGIENSFLKSNSTKVTESNPIGASNAQEETNKTISQTCRTNFQNSLNTESKHEKEINTAVQLPVISSVFSIPLNLYGQSNFSLTHQSNGLGINASDTKCFVVPTNKNVDVSQKKVIDNGNLLESNSDNITSSKHANTCLSPRIQRNGKRLLPGYSPKNSVFRITDSSSTNIEYDFKNSTVINELNNKKQKTNELANNDNAINSGLSIPTAQTYLPQIPPKIVALTGSVNATAPNTAPVYWIVSQNPQTVQNKNPGIFMVLNNDYQVINNSGVKVPVSLANINVPVNATTIPGVTNTQVPKSNNQAAQTVLQQLPLHAFTVMNTESAVSVTEASRSMKPEISTNSIIQSQSCSTIKNINSTDNSKANEIKLISTSVPQNLIQTNNVNFYTIPTTSSNITSLSVPQNNMPVIPNSSKNVYVQNINPHMNQTVLAGTSKFHSLSTIKPKPDNQTIPIDLFSIQNQLQQPQFRPIKSISLGKNKNAIQQIRMPVKIADVKNSLSAKNNNLVISSNISNSQSLKLSNTMPNKINPVKPVQNIVNPQVQMQKKVYDFIPYKPKIDSIIAKKNINSCEHDVTNKDRFSKVQSLNLTNLSNESNSTAGIPNSAYLYLNKEIIQSNPVNVSNTHNLVSTENALSLNTMAIKNSQPVFKPSTDGSKNSTLATIQELFPPPVSMIPVSVVQTSQTANKPAVTKVVVLQNPNLNNCTTQISDIKNQRKFAPSKVAMKNKKIGRKTVRELLQERHRDLSSTKLLQSRVGTKILKPIYKLGSNGLLLPPDLPNFLSKFPTVSNSEYITSIKNNLTSNPNKRPNIMILPSAAKTSQSIVLSKEDSKKDFQHEFQNAEISQEAESNNSDDFNMPSDFLIDKMTASKEYRPRYYDMSELRIGYFKVEDDLDSYGRFRSKFKVLFKKSLFVYDFPVTKCNQIDTSSGYSYEEIVRIQVPFKTVLSMNMRNRHVLIQVNKSPLVFLKNTEEESAFISNLKEKSKIIESILDSLQNSSIHKITLRKRQADNLKVNLCQFDSRFLVLCSINTNNTNVIFNVSPFDDEVADPHSKRIFQKNRRSAVRRLPQWDTDHTDEPSELVNSDPLVSSNHVCSCRISCRSLRCSCVKAAKSCGASGVICLCTNCDNPLNILQSFGISLEFSLNDCCLFQNIYQIPKLRSFLQRNVKLSCCNTVARVLDCIPGTTLCPNTECNAQLEFSWCGTVICYPERNPRNHCSTCGQCCFSNGRHCPICNRCYIVTPKYLDCPHCSGFMTNAIHQNAEYEDIQFAAINFQSSLKNSSKPEIIVLDGPSNTNSATDATLSVPEESDVDVQKESEDIIHLNQENIDNKDDIKNIFLTLPEEILNTCAQPEICDKHNGYEDESKNNINSKIVEKITN